MIDDEMLALAARVVGAFLTDERSVQPGRWVIPYGDGLARYWDPRNDDGDAVRLAVSIPLELELPGEGAVIIACGGQWFVEVNQDDPCAAVRLAILRAVAHHGKNLKIESK